MQAKSAVDVEMERPPVDAALAGLAAGPHDLEDAPAQLEPGGALGPDDRLEVQPHSNQNNVTVSSGSFGSVGAAASELHVLTFTWAPVTTDALANHPTFGPAVTLL